MDEDAKTKTNDLLKHPLVVAILSTLLILIIIYLNNWVIKIFSIRVVLHSAIFVISLSLTVFFIFIQKKKTIAMTIAIGALFILANFSFVALGNLVVPKFLLSDDFTFRIEDVGVTSWTDKDGNHMPFYTEFKPDTKQLYFFLKYYNYSNSDNHPLTLETRWTSPEGWEVSSQKAEITDSSPTNWLTFPMSFQNGAPFSPGLWKVRLFLNGRFWTEEYFVVRNA